MTKSMPGTAGDLAEQQPDIWSAYAALGKACADAGPLNLYKLCISVPQHRHIIAVPTNPDGL